MAVETQVQRIHLDEQPLVARNRGAHGAAPTILRVQEHTDRCKAILDELDRFFQFLESKGQRTLPYRTFRNEIQTEFVALEKLHRLEAAGENVQNRLDSSNLKFYEAVWAAAKQSSGLLGLRRWFYGAPMQSSKAKVKKGDRSAVLVDVVTKRGSEWIKVSTTTQKRVLFDLAKQGWQNGYSSDENDEGEDQHNLSDGSDADEILLIRTAEDLANAAKAELIVPRIRFIFTRLETGMSAETDAVLDRIRATGAIVQCADELEDPPALDDVLQNLMIDEFEDFSHVLNIDCTILIALASDICHVKIPQELRRHRQILDQIKAEEKEPFLSTFVYPALEGHPLVCTAKAAEHMRRLTQKIGTDSERARMAIVVGEDATKSAEALRKEFQALSIHPVPAGLQLPIKVVDVDFNDLALPPVVDAVAPELTDINKSVFFYGWANRNTTVSSNLGVVKQIRSLIARHRTSTEEKGPDVWIAPYAMSLLANEKKKGDEHGAPRARNLAETARLSGR
ncbi:hypothetical protein W97_08843 [Coniosporium apollinis CBS 100218]|uniref:DUF1308 domain-containing protein n=1 Tax=Coniosporium apollinis (strain CBS 100218) TaxID=1168221 RepID=R7Z660_CONA1|nr:uncharacterized protein W97_08843 [Coniosporium apollinis CBS 100218]EON69583.1 hypothetical protein W97_08843 [Coniosporium apollinis CBS 100218]